MSMVTETNSHVSAYQTAAKGPKKITLSESNVPTGGPFAITGAVFITASEPVGVTGSLSVTMLNHSLPVQITNIAALEITSGQLNVVLRAPTGPLGELLVVSPTPTIQMDFFNGLNSNTSIIQCISGGIVTAADGLLIISSGGGSDGGGERVCERKGRPATRCRHHHTPPSPHEPAGATPTTALTPCEPTHRSWSTKKVMRGSECDRRSAG